MMSALAVIIGYQEQAILCMHELKKSLWKI